MSLQKNLQFLRIKRSAPNFKLKLHKEKSCSFLRTKGSWSHEISSNHQDTFRSLKTHLSRNVDVIENPDRFHLVEDWTKTNQSLNCGFQPTESRIEIWIRNQLDSKAVTNCRRCRNQLSMGCFWKLLWLSRFEPTNDWKILSNESNKSVFPTYIFIESLFFGSLSVPGKGKSGVAFTCFDGGPATLPTWFNRMAACSGRSCNIPLFDFSE